MEDDEFPECPVCLDIYGIGQEHIRAPKILSCGDSLCKECLDRIIKKCESEFFNCPYCKSQVRKSPNIDYYITNKEIIRMVNSSFYIKDREENDKLNKTISFNVITLGSSGVGKTSILQLIKNGQFNEQYSPTMFYERLSPYYIKYKKKNINFFFMILQDKKNFIL